MRLRASRAASAEHSAPAAMTVSATTAATVSAATSSLRSMGVFPRREFLHPVLANGRGEIMAGALSERSPTPSIPAHLECGDEGLLRDLDFAELAHLLLARLLLLEQLALARDVAAVALGEHVLAQRAD